MSARLCDSLDCDAWWALCRACAPPDLDGVPLRCPRCQLRQGAYVLPDGLDALAELRASHPGSIGRWLLRLLARCAHVSGSALVAYPLAGAQGARVALDDECDALADALWTRERIRAILGPCRRMLQLARARALESDPAVPYFRFAMVYARYRVDAPILGWRRAVLAATVRSELSAVAQATRLDGDPSAPAYLGEPARAYLALRGGFERAGHTRAFPVTLHDLWLLRDRVAPAHRREFLACIVQGYFALRGGMPSRLSREDFRRTAGAWELRWSRRTKARRGDRLRAEAILAPQVAVVASVWLDSVLAELPPAGPLFPGLTKQATTSFLRLYLPPVSPEYVVRAHGVRAGTATVLRALGVPTDVIRSWGWWARKRGADGHYAAVVLNICLTVSPLLHLVRLRRRAPGLVEFLGLDGGVPLPAFDMAGPVAPALAVPALAGPGVRPPEAPLELSSSSDEEVVVVPAGALPAEGPRRRGGH